MKADFFFLGSGKEGGACCGVLLDWKERDASLA